MRSGEPDDIESLAAAWVIRSSERALDADEQRELDDWLEADSRHLGAYVRAQAVWLDVDRVAALDAGSRAPDPEEEEAPRSRRWLPYAAAASILLSLGGGYAAYDQYLSGRTASAPGEIRRIALEDGSTMFLNGDSVVQVRYTAGQRRVVLRRGEALFQVQHDTSRPFIVDAQNISVRAVGTEFSVSVDPEQQVAVTVAEGRVQLSGDGATRVAGGQYLGRDEQFFASPRGSRRAELDADEVQRRLAWHDGLLVFNGQRLADAVAQVNRYAATPIEINDAKLGRAEIVGTFRIGDSRTFADSAAAAFDGEVRSVDGKLVLMRRQDSPSH